MERVIIIGSSIAGMSVAKVMSKYANEVIIIERNKIPTQPEYRKGTPQAAHVHVLLNRGYKIMNELFPRTTEIITELGGRDVDFGRHFWWYQKDQWKKRSNTDLNTYALSRPLLDFAIMSQLKETKNIKIIDNSTVEEYLYDQEQNRIIGLSFYNKDTDMTHLVDCDLLIDASGRGTKTPRHLEDLGFEPVPVNQVEVGVKYSSRYYERPEHIDFVGLAVYFNAPKTSRMGMIVTAEDKFMVALGGMKGDHPPTDEAGYMEFMKNLDDDSLYEIVKRLKPISDFKTFNFDASKWRQYHKMGEFPNRFLVIGDAYSSFNPIYGQGMSIALSEVKILDEIMQKHSGNLKKVQKKYFKEVPKIIDVAWTLATSEDLKFDWVEGERPIGLKQLHWLGDRIAEASYDAKVNRTFLEVLHLKKGISALMNPIFLARVFWKNIFKPKTAYGPNMDSIIRQCTGPAKKIEEETITSDATGKLQAIIPIPNVTN